MHHGSRALQRSPFRNVAGDVPERSGSPSRCGIVALAPHRRNLPMRRVTLIVPVALALLAIACPSPKEPPPTAGAAGAPPPPAQESIDSKDMPPADGIFRIGLRANPPDLDPILVSDTTS